MTRAAVGMRPLAWLVGLTDVIVFGVARNVLVRVMAKVTRVRPRFMLAIAAHRRPGELQRHQHQQEKDQIATHKRKDYRRTRVSTHSFIASLAVDDPSNVRRDRQAFEHADIGAAGISNRDDIDCRADRAEHDPYRLAPHLAR